MHPIEKAWNAELGERKGIHAFDVTPANVCELPCCGVKNPEHTGRQGKIAWLHANLPRGVKVKVLLTDKKTQLGYLEYLPSEYAWRGVRADGYTFIHCIWTYWKEYQHRGLGGLLVEACLADARKARTNGVAVVCRERPWLANSALFLKHDFVIVDTAQPDYQLLVKKFRKSAPTPRFKGNWTRRLSRYGDGLTIIYSGQCPHSVKYGNDIAATARDVFQLQPRMVELKTHRDAQLAPTPYAVFAVIYNGQLLADYQIGKSAFSKAMRRALHLETSESAQLDKRIR